MKPKAAPAKGRRSGQTPPRPTRAIKTEPARERCNEVERPLDAEDIALASLEAQVRAREARADLGSVETDGVLAVRLPRALISQFEAAAVKRRISPSELIKRAVVEYLGM